MALAKTQAGQFEAATELWERYLRKQPKDLEAWAILGTAYGAANRFSDAAGCFEKIIKSEPNNFNGLYNYAFAHLQAENYPAACKYFKKALLIQPNSIEALFNYGHASLMSSKLDEAESSFSAVIQRQPRLVDAYLRLSLVYSSTERYREALETCEKGLTLDPRNASLTMQKGNTLAGLGDYGAAALALYKSLEIDPTLAEACFALGSLFEKQGKLDEAARHFRTAIDRGGDKQEALTRLGKVYYQYGRHGDAVLAFQQSLALDDSNPHLHYNLASALETVGNIAEAEVAYRKALELKPDYDEALAGVAHILEKRHDFKEAEKLIQPLISGKSNNPGLLGVYADLSLNIGKEKEALAVMETFLAQDKEQEQRELIHFKLGKIYDKTGDYDKAFHHYQMGNLANPFHYEIGEQGRFVDACIEVFGSGRLRELPISSTDSEVPVFIIGMPRSGTSLVEQILSSHNSVFGAGELTDIEHMAGTLSTQNIYSGDNEFPKGLTGIDAALLDRYAFSYLDKLNKLSDDAQRVTDKMPHNFRYLGLIQMLFPNARIVHCQRDPVDTCLSIFFQQFSGAHAYAQDLTALGDYYCQYRRLMDFWEDVLSLPVLDVSYEDVVRDKDTMIRKLIDFCDLPWDKDCLNFHTSKRVVNTPSYDQVRRPIYRQSVERWRHYENHLEALFKALGPYTPGAIVTNTSQS